MIQTRLQRITDRLDMVPFGYGSLDPIICEEEVFLEPPSSIEGDEPIVRREYIPEAVSRIRPSIKTEVAPKKDPPPIRMDLDIVRVSNFSENVEAYRIQCLFMDRFHLPIRNIFVSDCRRFAFVHLFCREHAEAFYTLFLRFPFQNQVLETKRMYV